MTDCYICKKEYFGTCRFSNQRDTDMEMFTLCIECYHNFIKAFKVSRETVCQAKGSFKSIINKENAKIGQQINEILNNSTLNSDKEKNINSKN
jgi:hypothetical protein